MFNGMGDLTIFIATLLGVVQGLTELLPISSSGHLILVREVLGVVGNTDLAFDAMLHFATALAIVTYFHKDVGNLIRAGIRILQKLKNPQLDADELLVVALAVGTIPAVVLGLLLEDMLETAFRNPLLVAGALTVGALIMLGAEVVQKRRKKHLVDGTVGHVGWRSGLMLGLFQSLALVPGMSRSGMTISGGMFLGLARAYSAKFAFLLGVPLLLGAGAKKVLEFGLGDVSFVFVWGSVAAFLVAIAVIHFLLRFLRTYSLHVFVAYRLILALVVILFVV